ncbi:hypothetical protein AVEN_273336-1 [Araneus ventricosus]|uniref:Uncharacterized protein n=1 Tax=Araneus ventricosus TaxID=182803 RepID=A0A4Y2IKX8_ARAVE|nr:hypothetical protein AVEN_273336-1 [Araneus ventricosus]
MFQASHCLCNPSQFFVWLKDFLLSLISSSIRSKEHHPSLPKLPGKQLKDRTPQQIVRHCGSCIIAPITSGSCSNPPFYRGTTRHRKWAQRATPPLLSHRVDESLITYTAASPPQTHGVPPMESARIRGKSYRSQTCPEKSNGKQRPKCPVVDHKQGKVCPEMTKASCPEGYQVSCCSNKDCKREEVCCLHSSKCEIKCSKPMQLDGVENAFKETIQKCFFKALPDELKKDRSDRMLKYRVNSNEWFNEYYSK